MKFLEGWDVWLVTITDFIIGGDPDHDADPGMF